MIDVTGKYALITGSSRGIGQQIAIGLADLNCNVILHGRTKESCATTAGLLKDKGVRVFVVYGDLSRENQVHDLINQVHDLNVPLDILYNNAAIMTPYRVNHLEHTYQDWTESMNVNVTAPYLLCTAFIPKMVERGFGRIVNVVSGITHEPELAPYAASKAALIKLTDDLASKYKDVAVRINMLDPGWLRTDLGGEFAHNAVEDVMPGALAPALVENDGANGQLFKALEL